MRTFEPQRLDPVLFKTLLDSLGLFDADTNLTHEWIAHRTGTIVVCFGGYAFKFLPDSVDLAERRRQFEVEVSHQALMDDRQRASLGCYAVSQLGGQLAIGEFTSDFAEIVDYVLLMRRLRPSDNMFKRFQTGNVPEFFPEALGDVLAEFHSRCARYFSTDHVTTVVATEMEAQHRDLTTAKLVLDQSCLPDVIDGLKTARLLAMMEERMAVEAIRSSMIARGNLGMIRDVHGDLHIENWWLMNGEIAIPDVMPYDRYRIVDVLRDVARVSLELATFGNRDLASRFIRRYLERHPQAQCESLFEYFTLRLAVADLARHLKAYASGSARFSKTRLGAWNLREQVLRDAMNR